MLIKELIVGVVAAVILALISTVIRYRRHLRLLFGCTLFHRDREIRVSMASILCIHDAGRYLLVRNRRRPELFGPFGGVYKYYPSALQELDRYRFRPQISGHDHVMDNDLRGFVPAKYLPSFIRWFNTGRNREIEPLTRELLEELEEIGLPSEAQNVKALQYELIRTIYEGPRLVPGVNYFQFRYLTVYGLISNDPHGKELLDTLFGLVRNNPDLLAVTADEIGKRRAASGELIGSHTSYLIGDERRGQDEAPFM